MSNPNLFLSNPNNPANGDQYREYYIPENAVKEEQELLDEYDTDRFAQVLYDIYNEFYLMIELMRGYSKGKNDEDLIYFLLAQRLQHPLDRLNKACSIVVDWQLITKRTIESKSEV